MTNSLSIACEKNRIFCALCQASGFLPFCLLTRFLAFVQKVQAKHDRLSFFEVFCYCCRFNKTCINRQIRAKKTANAYRFLYQNHGFYLHEAACQFHWYFIRRSSLTLGRYLLILALTPFDLRYISMISCKCYTNMH